YELKGEEIILNLKQEWLNQTIRIYAYIENPNHKVGNTLHIYAPIEYKEEGLVDVSGEMFALLVGTRIKNVYYFTYNAINKIANIGRDKLEKIDGIPIQTLSRQEAREWYNKKLKRLGNPYQEIRDLIQRAEKICELRNITKQQTRELMEDRIMAWILKYNPRTKIKPFKYYVKQQKKRGYKGNKIYENIINSFNKTNRKVNDKYLRK
ncbi:hypothetical protein, partial [Helicobacter cinaedi]